LVCDDYESCAPSRGGEAAEEIQASRPERRCFFVEQAGQIQESIEPESACQHQTCQEERCGQISTVTEGEETDIDRTKEADALRKSGLPEKRNVRTRDVADSFEDHTRSLAGARKDRSEDYARWFRIISGDAGETKPGDLVTESRPRQVEKSREWKEAITQLRIQELLLSGPFKLITTAPNNSRIITFLPNGAIGTGRTHLVARWRLFEGRLELLDAGEEVQSRFIVSSDGRFLTQILDPTAPSASPSQLVRVAAKS